ncbi:MAG TPA: UvrD-helicase domain-containing protein [Gemmatimonadaceae bacterium]|nr:UvrD-helicase domain-containing protein [Gemmatimonadaceae bacterium]
MRFPQDWQGASLASFHVVTSVIRETPSEAGGFSAIAPIAPGAPHIASGSQRSAIEAEPGPLLVLAGPGAGKTYCLIERIRFLVEQRAFDPARICAFTFTNKAAGEISSRLSKHLGPNAELIKRGTIHAFCAELLREFAEEVGLQPGFGIADEDYQLLVLRRVEGFRRWHRMTLTRFSAHRFREDSLRDNDLYVYNAYRQFLEKRNLVDFDMLVLKTAELLRDRAMASRIASRWDCILVDEFQDLNPVQYMIVRALGASHTNVFAVGDDEQSIYSWAGADPQVFVTFVNDFKLTSKAQLGENRRCPCDVVSLARRLVNINTPIFADRRHAETDRTSPFPVVALSFESEESEMQWIIDDLRRDRETNRLEWGDYALLYRTHEIGYCAEAGFLSAGIPCRMAQGRALAEDTVVAYVIAALKVIADPSDPIHQENFLQVVLPRALFDDARAQAEERDLALLPYLEQLARGLAKEHGDRRKIWRGFYALRNLAALGKRHDSIATVVDELLSQCVGEYRTVLEDNHDELSDPAENDEVQQLAARLQAAFDSGKTVWIPRLGGVEIGLKGMLAGIGLNRVQLGGLPPADAISVGNSDCRSLGIALGLFKAAQLIRSSTFSNRFRDFTAVDIETTDKDIRRAELVELAAIRVRNGRIVDEFHSLVKPRVPIAPAAAAKHGYHEDDLAEAPYFEDVWPTFRQFCGRDIVVAHNGYHFDFPILRRMVGDRSDANLCTYDTLLLARELHTGSAKLEDLSRSYGIDLEHAHHALDDTRALAHLFLALGETKVARARKTALDNILDHLGVALALSDPESLCEEAKKIAKMARGFALGRYSNCLDMYRSECEQCRDVLLPGCDELIELLGGEALMLKIRAEKTAEQRYPGAMQRLRPLLELCDGKPLADSLCDFLDRVVLSKMDGAEPETARVNLLTLHSTKGLEFSRVYIVGVEDTQLPGGKDPVVREVEEARRLLYVGMTRTKDRLVLTRVADRNGKPTGGHQFLDEMQLQPILKAFTAENTENAEELREC